MNKYLAMFAVLAALGINASPAAAQYREAVLQRVEVPTAGFDILLATSRPEGWTFGPDQHSWAQVVYVGDRLAHPINDEMVRLTRGVGALTLPACTFEVHGGRNVQSPVAVYVVRKDGLRRASALQVR